MAKNDKKTKKGPLPQTELSERGTHLERAHKDQQYNSINHGKKFVVGKDDNGNDITITIGEKCHCGHRIRGPKHLEGAHHRGTVPACGKR